MVNFERDIARRERSSRGRVTPGLPVPEKNSFWINYLFTFPVHLASKLSLRDRGRNFCKQPNHLGVLGGLGLETGREHLPCSLAGVPTPPFCIQSRTGVPKTLGFLYYEGLSVLKGTVRFPALESQVIGLASSLDSPVSPQFSSMRPFIDLC